MIQSWTHWTDSTALLLSNRPPLPRRIHRWASFLHHDFRLCEARFEDFRRIARQTTKLESKSSRMPIVFGIVCWFETLNPSFQICRNIRRKRLATRLRSVIQYPGYVFSIRRSHLVIGLPLFAKVRILDSVSQVACIWASCYSSVVRICVISRWALSTFGYMIVHVKMSLSFHSISFHLRCGHNTPSSRVAIFIYCELDQTDL